MTTRTATVTWTQANARRIERQGLAAPTASSPDRAVAAMLAAHAQVSSAAELSVGLRLAGATRTDVRRALWNDRTLVRTYGPRGTVHLLTAAELPLWTGALSAIPAGTGPFRKDVRLSADRTEEVLAAVGDALTGAELTIDELSDAVVARTGPWAGDRVMPAFQDMWPRWRQVMHLAGHRGVLCFAPDRGRKVTYTNPGATPLDGPEALAGLVHRYLYAYGPATPQHFAKWLAAPNSWAVSVFAEQAGSGAIEEVAYEGGGPAWLVAGDTDFPAGRRAGFGCSPTSMRSPSRRSRARGSSRALRTPARWRVARRGTTRCC